MASLAMRRSEVDCAAARHPCMAVGAIRRVRRVWWRRRRQAAKRPRRGSLCGLRCRAVDAAWEETIGGSGEAAGAGVLRMHGWPEKGRKGMASGLRVPGAGVCGGKTWCRSVAAAW